MARGVGVQTHRQRVVGVVLMVETSYSKINRRGSEEEPAEDEEVMVVEESKKVRK